MASLLRTARHAWPEMLAAAACMLSILVTMIVVSQGRFGNFTESASILPPANLFTLTMIFSRNASVALGLFTGVLTGGVGSVVFLILVGSMLGWSMGISVSTLGLVETIARSWAYTPFELAGFVTAGAAGLHPIAQFLRRQSNPSLPVRPALPQALQLLILALGFLLVGAAMETLSIAIVA